ncbi:hypothetical protein ACQKE8_12910 [Sphingobium limneticum]|uniref:hypothetical protein n=1 Tax=Sphingobium limneticum TaxID=1007511 RepID=UPI003D044DB9
MSAQPKLKAQRGQRPSLEFRPIGDLLIDPAYQRAQLRREGRMAAFELALVSTDGAVGVPTLAQQVAAEVQQSTARRDAARTYSHSGYVGPVPTVGAQLQEKALDGSPQMAASIVRDRWGPTWTRLCQHARATGQKPVTAMIALLDKGLDAETIEGASA